MNIKLAFRKLVKQEFSDVKEQAYIIKVVGEAVDRATYLKPRKVGHASLCGNCRCVVEVRDGNFCHRCGQKIGGEV